MVQLERAAGRYSVVEVEVAEAVEVVEVTRAEQSEYCIVVRTPLLPFSMYCSPRSTREEGSFTRHLRIPIHFYADIHSTSMMFDRLSSKLTEPQ